MPAQGHVVSATVGRVMEFRPDGGIDILPLLYAHRGRRCPSIPHALAIDRIDPIKAVRGVRPKRAPFRSPLEADASLGYCSHGSQSSGMTQISSGFPVSDARCVMETSRGPVTLRSPGPGEPSGSAMADSARSR
jgi:hypothetical protein